LQAQTQQLVEAPEGYVAPEPQEQQQQAVDGLDPEMLFPSEGKAVPVETFFTLPTNPMMQGAVEVDDEDFDVSKAEQEQATMSARVDTYYCLPTNPAGAEVDDIHDDDLPNVSETPYNYKESDEPVEAATGVRVVQVG